MNLPSAIIFINSDLNDILKNTLLSQLHITDNMTGQEFDSRVNADPNYPQIIHANHLRILVIRDNFQDTTNRQFADVVLFVKQGLASVLKNNYGPPGLTLPVQSINIYDLLRYNNSSEVKILPESPTSPQTCGCDYCCPNGLGGIFAIEAKDTSGVHCRNPDNIYNNKDFINRK